VVGLMALCVVGPTACSDSAPPSLATATPSVEGMSEQQTSALADGTVSYDEYHESFRRYAACLSEAGYTVLDQGEEYDLIMAGIPEDAVLDGTDETCNLREFDAVSTQWQFDHQDTSREAALAKACLEEHGLPVPDKLTERLDALSQNNIAIEECLRG